MEQWLWAERTTSNRRKSSDSDRDVPSCVVTYLYLVKHHDSRAVALLPGSDDLRHLSNGLRHLCFYLFGTSHGLMVMGRTIFIIRHFVPQVDECRPGRCGRAGRFLRARGRKAWRHFDATLFGFGARHRRR